MTFYDFLMDDKIVNAMIGIMIAQEAKSLVDSFVNDLVIPFFAIDINGDGEKDIDFKDRVITFRGVEIKIGSFIENVIKGIVILYLVYEISKISANLKQQQIIKK